MTHTIVFPDTAIHFVEGTFPGSNETHLFNGKQTFASPYLTALCKRNVKTDTFSLSNNEPMCQDCVRLENELEEIASGS